jgi:hypothetical protein
MACASLRTAMVAAILLGGGTSAHASLVIDPTFSSTITSDPGAAGIESAINGAISTIEGDITSPNNINVQIYFTEVSSGLGQSTTTTDNLSYYQYYNAFAAVVSSAAQLSALSSLGPAPSGPGSGNPVNGNTTVQVTSAEARNLGFSDPGVVTVGSGTYDSEISLNTSITYPPGPNNGSNYGLQAVANHEIDEALGIGGTGSTLGNDDLTGPVGDLDLYRYSAPGVRSYSDVQKTTPYSYFSVNGGDTVLSYFNQTAGDDYGDWLSNPIPAGFGAQVQDAFGEPGTNPTLGPNELLAFNAIGYEVIAPEPSTLLLFVSGLAIIAGAGLRKLRRYPTARE